MIHIQYGDTITYSVIPLEIPEAINGRRFKNLERLLDKQDITLPTLALLNGKVIEPFAPLDSTTTGDLKLIYEGITYHAKIGN